MKCEILVTTRRGQKVAGTISLEKGKLTSTSQKRYEKLIKSVKEDKTIVGSKTFDPKKDPRGWLQSLPKVYSGSHFRARLVEEKHGDKKTDRSKETRHSSKG